MARGKSAYARHKARVLALQALYEADVAGHPAGSSFRWLNEGEHLPEESSGYALELIQGVSSQQDDIDAAIFKFAPAWPVKQLPVIDRTILRLALFEIRYGPEIPHKVAINEAIELAKSFGSESSARFVNGVLGSVMEEIAGGSPPAMASPQLAQKNARQKRK